MSSANRPSTPQARPHPRGLPTWRIRRRLRRRPRRPDELLLRRAARRLTDLLRRPRARASRRRREDRLHPHRLLQGRPRRTDHQGERRRHGRPRCGRRGLPGCRLRRQEGEAEHRARQPHQSREAHGRLGDSGALRPERSWCSG